jgi:hypothetical protein
LIVSACGVSLHIIMSVASMVSFSCQRSTLFT